MSQGTRYHINQPLTLRLGDNLLDMDRLNLGRLTHEFSVGPGLPLPPSLQ